MSCKRCGGAVHPTNTCGYCIKTPECRRLRDQVKNAKDHNVAARKRYMDENWDAQMWAAAHARAKRKGIPFTITREDIRQILRDTCPVFEKELIRSGGHRPHAHGPWSPSLDRIDNTKGYVPGNIQVLSVKANAMKGDATPEELLQFAAWVRATYGAVEGGDANGGG